MKQVRKKIKLICFVALLGVCLHSNVNAQTPADFPGGPGSGDPGFSDPSADGPVVPLDRGMSVMLIATGVAYVALQLKRQQLVAVK
ncbi:hypothetical protein [Parasediminibacterium sp. JCM 36343]|uniref:hypothetical protein n=1 Tax=Parasediminibacterium sp. JCM 36343 TaxID=3374279 RepID=UPI00397B91EF